MDIDRALTFITDRFIDRGYTDIVPFNLDEIKTSMARNDTVLATVPFKTGVSLTKPIMDGVLVFINPMVVYASKTASKTIVSTIKSVFGNHIAFESSSSKSKILGNLISQYAKHQTRLILIIDELPPMYYRMMHGTTEFIRSSACMYNPSRHIYVPKHTKIIDPDVVAEIKKLGTLPILLPTDIMSMYYEYSIGDYIMIPRGGGGIIYRLVSNSSSGELPDELIVGDDDDDNEDETQPIEIAEEEIDLDE
jgi:hypothetical protein